MAGEKMCLHFPKKDDNSASCNVCKMIGIKMKSICSRLTVFQCDILSSQPDNQSELPFRFTNHSVRQCVFCCCWKFSSNQVTDVYILLASLSVGNRSCRLWLPGAVNLYSCRSKTWVDVRVVIFCKVTYSLYGLFQCINISLGKDGIPISNPAQRLLLAWLFFSTRPIWIAEKSGQHFIHLKQEWCYNL